ncbi:MAG: transmembrane 220 family protein [Halioglobus sp.]
MIYFVLNSLFLLVYLASALVQYNDPDPWSWICIYLAATGMCIVWFRKDLPQWYPTTLLVISLIWIGTLLPSVVGKVSPADIVESISMQNRSIEEAREIGGLTLIAIWSAVLMKRKA